MRTHLIIPDTQVKPGVPLDHLSWIGRYIVEKKPDVVVHLGDHWDMHSLSKYDEGKRAMEGARVSDDIDSGNKGMRLLLDPLKKHNKKKAKWKEKQYKPRLVFTVGNHEYRINRYVEDYPKLHGFLGMHSLSLDEWEVVPFNHIIKIDGIAYSHYFYNPDTGKPYGGMMETRIKNVGFPFTQGHQQGKRVGERHLGDGTVHRGLVVGSCYIHDEKYKGPQGNHHYRGIVVKREVSDGNYDLMEVSLDFLCRKYEGLRLSSYMEKTYGADWRKSL